jgi:hypothetical protein
MFDYSLYADSDIVSHTASIINISSLPFMILGTAV